MKKKQLLALRLELLTSYSHPWSSIKSCPGRPGGNRTPVTGFGDQYSTIKLQAQKTSFSIRIMYLFLPLSYNPDLFTFIFSSPDASSATYTTYKTSSALVSSESFSYSFEYSNWSVCISRTGDGHNYPATCSFISLRKYYYPCLKTSWWVEQDSNLRSPKAPDLQSGPVDHFGTHPTKKIISQREPSVRFELTTCCLQNSCSTTELRRLRNPQNKKLLCL